MVDIQGLTEQQLTNCREWCAELRLGVYPQGKRYLKTDNGLCCLGVGCVIQDLREEDQSGIFVFYSPGDENKSYGYDKLPDEYWFEKTYGLNRTYQKMLAGENDRGRSFEQIADLIERWTGCNASN